MPTTDLAPHQSFLTRSHGASIKVERLDLNDPTGVEFRDGFITMLAAMNSEIEKAKLLLVEAQTTLDGATMKAAQDVAREVRDQVSWKSRIAG